VDEEITGRVEVKTVRDDKPICTLETTVSDADGDICLQGTATTYKGQNPQAGIIVFKKAVSNLNMLIVTIESDCSG